MEFLDFIKLELGGLKAVFRVLREKKKKKEKKLEVYGPLRVQHIGESFCFAIFCWEEGDFRVFCFGTIGSV